MSRLRLNIANKLALGYLPLLLLTALIGTFTLITLSRMNHVTESILRVDVPLVEAVDQLVENLLAQDLYGRRHLLLRDPEMEQVFRQRSEIFWGELARLRDLRGPADPWIDGVEGLYREYQGMFEAGFAREGELGSEENGALRATQGELLETLREEATGVRKARNVKTLRISEMGAQAFQVTVILFFLGAAAAGVAALVISRRITSAVHRLQGATREISEGRFDRVPKLHTGDELEELAQAFAAMSARLQRMEQLCLDASPLTRLPGGEAIEEALRQRIERGEPVAFCLVDMDNFKAYSDKYGYARGSEVIKVLARILERAVEQKGRPEDFVGHIGGDDFVLLTSRERARGLCEEVLRSFDAVIPDFYGEEDRRRGFICSKNRQGEPATFPLVSLSIAVVTETDALHRDPISIGEAAARLKERAKEVPGSVCLIDREQPPRTACREQVS
ncbi:MAG: diguanylate cyclase [Deferrisomatales bacterium]|nr:diguanylate cyclase [Deferrisomatales bacterium]